MMGCLVPRRECSCQAEKRAKEKLTKEHLAKEQLAKEQAALLDADKDKELGQTERQEDGRRNRLFGFGILKNLFGSTNLNLGSANSSNSKTRVKSGAYRALAQEEPQGTVNSDLEDLATSPGSILATSPGSMASAASLGSRMSTTGTESPAVVPGRLPTIVSLR